MFKKLRISLIYSNLVVTKSLNSNHRMHNLYANFVRILGVCKRFSKDLVNDKGNMPRCGVVPRFSDLEVVALSLTEETMGYDSESYLFGQLKDYRDQMPNLISRRQYNDRRKYTAALCEKIRKRVAESLDGGEEIFIVDSKPVKVCQPARGNRNTMGKTCPEKAPDFGYCATQALYFFGYKLHAVCGISGMIHSYDLTKASVHDIKYLNDVGQDYSFGRIRKKVETDFSQFTDRFNIMRNYVKLHVGFFTRIISKVSAFNVSQYLNFINNRPIGRIKYALA